MADLVFALRSAEVRQGERVLLHDVTLECGPGAIVGLVGSSGSGKTLTCRVLLGMVDLQPGVVRGELVVFRGDRELRPYTGCLGAGRRARDRAFREIRGDVMGILPQDAPSALDPYARVGRQIAAAARLAKTSPDPVPWLVRTGFSPVEAARVAAAWPHQLSGGMAQRVVVAQALARGSRFLLADEPTTGLDAPLQRRILRLLRQLADDGLGVLLVTHDLPSLAEVADRVLLMDGGRVTEELTPIELRSGVARTGPGQSLLGAGIGAGKAS